MVRNLMQVCLVSFRKGLGAAWSILIIMIPVSFVMTLLQYTGFLKHLTWILAPFMSMFSLPAEASMALIVGALINIYAGIAVMGTMSLSLWDINIIAVMMLICHNLIVESAVQSKTGVSGLKMTAFRIVAAFSMGLFLSLVLPESFRSQQWAMGAVVDVRTQPLFEMLMVWSLQTALLTLKVILIILGLTVMIDLMRYYRLFTPVVSILRPFTRINGLPHESAFMWMAGLVFGLAYGSGVLIAESRAGHLDRDGLIRLNLSLGISHSLIEDTLLFVAIGASLFWVLVPRVIAAALVVWAFVLARSYIENRRGSVSKI
ncbi:MAG TPA: hypothetical protein PLU81_03775 [Deltaproteobacteria bacterium]|nr:hypothetical protein [Deltaproteobacteria bacterium]